MFIFAAVAVAGPTYHLTPEHMAEIAPALNIVAQAIPQEYELAPGL